MPPAVLELEHITEPEIILDPECAKERNFRQSEFRGRENPRLSDQVDGQLQATGLFRISGFARCQQGPVIPNLKSYDWRARFGLSSFS